MDDCVEDDCVVTGADGKLLDVEEDVAVAAGPVVVVVEVDLVILK